MLNWPDRFDSSNGSTTLQTSWETSKKGRLVRVKVHKLRDNNMRIDISVNIPLIVHTKLGFGTNGNSGKSAVPKFLQRILTNSRTRGPRTRQLWEESSSCRIDDVDENQRDRVFSDILSKLDGSGIEGHQEQPG